MLQESRKAARSRNLRHSHRSGRTHGVAGRRTIDFVRSGEEKRRFWTFRPDNQSVYLFEAQRKEETVLTVDGQEEQVVRVEWGLSGWRRTFYKGDQWYRVSDGYLISESRDDQLMELVSVSSGPGRQAINLC